MVPNAFPETLPDWLYWLNFADSSFHDGLWRAKVTKQAGMDAGLRLDCAHFDRHERGVKDDAKSS